MPDEFVDPFENYVKVMMKQLTIIINERENGRMKKTKGMRLAVLCLAGALLAGSVFCTAKKVTIKGKKKVSMKVGEKKQFKANQKVKWTVKGKSVAIVKGKNAKAVTVQAKKKGSSTLTAKKGNKSAAVKIQVAKKTADQKKNDTNQNTDTKPNPDVNITDMTLLTDVTFYKVTNVNGNTITVLSADNKEYTTTTKADIPIMKDDEVITAAAVKPGEYFRCSPFTYNNVTTYAALVISESDYQTMMKFRNEGNGNPQYTKSIATFYIVNKREHTFDLACSQNGAKYATVIPDEDTVINVNGVKEKDAGDRLQAGQRVLVQYGWESSPGNFVNLDSIVVY